MRLLPLGLQALLRDSHPFELGTVTTATQACWTQEWAN